VGWGRCEDSGDTPTDAAQFTALRRRSSRPCREYGRPAPAHPGDDGRPAQRTWVDLKKRKKFEPASMARPAASASSIFLDDVIPLLPSAAGQSLWSMTRIGRTSHQIGGVFMRLLSTTGLWVGVRTNTGPVGGPGIFPSATRVSDRSTEDACMVHVPGTGLLGSGHCVEIA